MLKGSVGHDIDTRRQQRECMLFVGGGIHVVWSEMESMLLTRDEVNIYMLLAWDEVRVDGVG